MSRPLTAAQVNRDMGWTPEKLRAYWDARARACREYADEGACLAQVARHVPVTLGLGGYVRPFAGLGTTPPANPQCPPLQLDAAAIAALTGNLLANPEATLRAQGPRIVNAIDREITAPLISSASRTAAPIFLKWLGPPLAVLYAVSITSMIFSFRTFKEVRESGITKNRGRRKGRK